MKGDKIVKLWFRPKYRIVRDYLGGYEVQFRVWWFPFWIQHSINSHATLRMAEEYIKDIPNKKNNVVKYIN